MFTLTCIERRPKAVKMQEITHLAFRVETDVYIRRLEKQKSSFPYLNGAYLRFRYVQIEKIAVYPKLALGKKWKSQRYQELAFDKCRGIEKMAVYQELAFDKMENPALSRASS